MCRVAAFLLFMTAGLLSLGARELTSGIVALQEGRIVYVRSTLSGSEDVVIPLHIGPANGQIIFGHTFLVPAETPMEPAQMAAAKWPFQPAGACVIRHWATALRDFDLGYMGFIQSSPLHAGENSRLLSCIPKTLPFSSGGRDYDFRVIQDLSTPPSEPLIFSVDRGNVADAAKLPDRFIQILSEGKKQVGFVMGYSLLKGLTKPEVRAANTGSPVFIYATGKTYPAAIDRNARPVKEGDTFDCLAYRQYFDPLSHPEATTVYRHNQDGDEMLYAEFHRRAKKAVLPFPKDLWGKKFGVVEKTDSVEIAAVGKIPSGGVPLEVRGVGGSVVLRVPCD